MRILFLLLSCFLWVGLSSIQAKDLRVALSDVDYPPYYFIKGGEYYGASMEVAQHVAKQLGHQLTFERYPWARVIESLRRGDADMAIHLFNTSERAIHVIYTGVPHIFESSFFFVHKDQRVSFEGTLKSLSKYSIGVVRGYSHGDEFDEAKYLQKRFVVYEKQLLQLLQKKRIDIAVGNRPAILLQAQKLKIANQFLFLNPVIDDGPNYMAFSRTRKDAASLAAEFTEAIVEFKKTGEYQKILKKYNFSYPTFSEYLLK